MVPRPEVRQGMPLTAGQSALLKWLGIALIWLAAPAPLWIMLVMILVHR